MGGQEERILEQEESFGGDGYVHCPDCGTGCRSVYIYQNLPN